MQRSLFLSLLLSIALIPSAQAQRGMAGGGGFHGGGGFARGGAVAGPRAGFRGGPAIGGRVMAPPGRVFVPGGARTFNRGVVVAPGGHQAFSFNFRRQRRNIFLHNCFTFGCRHGFFNNGFFFGNPFLASPFFGYGYIPGFDYGYGYGSPYYDYGYQQSQPVVVQSDNGGNTQLAMEVQRLSDEISDLRGEQAMQRMEAARQQQAPGTSMSVVNPAASTTFVFHDGRRVTAQNYAITGQTLWILNEHTSRKFSLADVDRQATEQVNSASGVDLHLPEPAKH